MQSSHKQKRDLPGVQSPPLKMANPKEEASTTDPSVALPYASNTTITNNTNIVIVGGKSYMINTSGRSPPEIIEITADPNIPIRPSSKIAEKKIDTSQNYGSQIKKNVNYTKPFQYTSTGDNDLWATNGQYAISHKRTTSVPHGSHSRKASRALANITKMHEIHQSKSQVSESKAMQLKAQNPQSVSIAVGKGKKKQSGISTPSKCSFIQNPRKASIASSNKSNEQYVKHNPKTEGHTKENSIEIASALSKKHFQPEKVVISILKSIIWILLNLEQEKTEAKAMDPKREKEMIELSEFIKKCNYFINGCKFS